METENNFHLFTSIRYDPLLLTSEENSQSMLSFISPSPFYMLVYHRDRMLEAAQHFDFFAVAVKLADGVALHRALTREVEDWVSRGGRDQALKLRILFDKEANMTVEFSVLPPVPISTLYPPSLDPPKSHVASSSKADFKPSPLTGGALQLGPTDSLPSSSPPPPPRYMFRLDSSATPSTAFTLLKTTYRTFYDASRKRALPSNPAGAIYAEVLLYNEVDELTEGTMTSLYLFRGGRWVTPPVGVPAGEFDASTLRSNNGSGHENHDEGELRRPFAGRWGHSVRSAKVGAGGQRGTSRRWALKKGFCMEEPVHKETVKVGEEVWVSNGVRGFAYGQVVA